MAWVCGTCRKRYEWRTGLTAHYRHYPDHRVWVSGNKPVAFGQDMRQPEGFNPPPLELRSPEPKQGQLV